MRPTRTGEPALQPVPYAPPTEWPGFRWLTAALEKRRLSAMAVLRPTKQCPSARLVLGRRIHPRRYTENEREQAEIHK